MRLRITNANLIDGTGAPPRPGELLLEDGYLAEVGEVTLSADETLDVKGLAVAPGFIDIHSHNDFSMPVQPLSEPKVLQGITTEVVGNCGMGLSPANDRVDAMYARMAPLLFGESAQKCSRSLADYRTRVHDIGVSVNAAMLVPHGNVRCAAMGLDERRATPSELDEMRAMVDREMRAGAFGVSTGLVYPPGAFADTDELVAMAERVAPFGGLYATHMRDEGTRLPESVAEAISIGERAKVPVQLSHHKAAGPLNWGLVHKTLAMVDAARARGLDVNSDVYPYTAGSSVLAAMALPTSVLEGDHATVMARLTEPASRKRIIKEAKERMLGFLKLPGLLGFLPRRLVFPLFLLKMSEVVVISSVHHQHHLEGKTLRQIVRERRRPLFDVVLDLLVEEDLAVLGIAHVMSEDDVRAVFQHAMTMVGSDGLPMRDGKPHPRTYGTFPRVLGRYVREAKLMPLAQAVHRMTGMSAKKIGLKGRGELRPGGVADVVVFDPDTVLDTATYDDPRQSPIGIPHVFVGGQWTVKDGKHTGARNGRVLERGAA